MLKITYEEIKLITINNNLLKMKLGVENAVQIENVRQAPC